MANLKGRRGPCRLVTHFKEVQRLKTQLDQYTDLSDDHKASIERVLPDESLRGFKGQYLAETANAVARATRQSRGGRDGAAENPVDQLDFEFVLFASAVIDYDYIMGLIATYSAKGRARPR